MARSFNLHPKGEDAIPMKTTVDALSTLDLICSYLRSPIQLRSFFHMTLEQINRISDVSEGLVCLRDELFEAVSQLDLSPLPAPWLLRRIHSIDALAIDGSRMSEDLSEPGAKPARLQVPILVANQILGTLTITSHRTLAYHLLDRHLVQSLATMLGYSLYGERLRHRHLVAEAEHAALLWEARQSVTISQAVFESISSPMYIIDSNYTLIAANVSCLRTAHASSTDAGFACFTRLHGLAKPCSGCRVSASLEKLIETHRIAERMQDSGDSRIWEIMTFPIRQPGQLKRMALVLERDITLEFQARDNRARIKRLTAIGQLADGLAHEISNPLAAILANAQFMKLDNVTPEERIQALDTIIDAADRAQGVIDRILNLSEEQNVNFEPVNVNETIKIAVDHLSNDLCRRSVDLELELDPNLPIIQGNSILLQRAWRFLMISAIGAMSPQGGSMRVRSGSSSQYVEIRFIDNGDPISSAGIDHIFEPYFTPDENGRGGGVSLHICQNIIRQHGGSISVETSQRDSTCFLVRIPVLADT